MAGRLLTIGRFSQLTGLTVRALRLYDEIGVLRPEAVDGESRYRYYAPGQLARAVLIRTLRQLDLPLEQIRRFLEADRQGRDRILGEHRARLGDRATAARDAIAGLDRLREDLEMAEGLSAPQITPMRRHSATDQVVMRVRWELPEEAAEDYPLAACYAEIAAAVERQGLIRTGAPYCVVYSDAADDGLVRGEAGIPVDRPGVADGRVEPSVLPGGEVATTRHTGPSGAGGDGAGVARALWTQIDSAGLSALGDPRWIYLSGPDVPPAEQVTELAWPVSDRQR